MHKQQNKTGKHRQKLRLRTRLRTGKIADINGNFLVDCQIFDRSEKGARLRTIEPCDLPDHVKIFDDERNVLLVAVVVWMNQHEIGVEFPKGLGNIETDGKQHAALGGRYYAVQNQS